MHGIAALPPDSPLAQSRQHSAAPNNNIVLPPKPVQAIPHPLSFRQQQPSAQPKKPPMPSPPASRMDSDVSLIKSFTLFFTLIILGSSYTFFVNIFFIGFGFFFFVI